MKTDLNNQSLLPRMGHVLINEYFKNDLARIMRQDILDMGYDESLINMDNVAYQFCVLQKRMLKMLPRKIEYADTFDRPTDPDLADGLLLLENKIRNGEDLNPHLSKTMLDVNYKDGMLFDWGIYHFHLGLAMQTQSHMLRTPKILYAFVTDDTVYCLTIAEHGRWEDKDLLEIIVRNWEYLLSPVEVEGEAVMTFSQDDIKRQRPKNKKNEPEKPKINLIHKLSNGM